MEWKAIKDFEDLYEVSRDGLIRSLDRTIGNRFYRGRVLKTSKQKDGYVQVRPSKNGKQKTLLVHRIVAEAFCQKVDGCDYVNHLDGNKENNHSDNLEWTTQSENLKHAFKTGLKNPSYKSNKIRLINLINNQKIYCDSQREAGRYLEVSETTIRRAIKNSSKINGYLIELI